LTYSSKHYLKFENKFTTTKAHQMKMNVPPRLVQAVLLFVFLLLHILPASAQWVRKTDALKKRSEVTSVVYNNKLYCFIGFGNSSLDVEPSSEVYDPATNTWSLLASMPSGKTVTHQGVTLVDNTVWHVGGRVGKAPGPLTSEIWIYNITTNSWSPGPQLRDPATGNLLFWGGGGAALVGRTLHVFGGFAVDACNNDQDKFHLTLDVDTWLSNPAGPVQWQNTRKPMPIKRNHFSTTVLNGKIYVLGGQFGHDCGGGQDKQYSHVYNPIANTWTELTTMPTPRSHAEGGIFPLDGKIYLVSGQGSNGVSTNKVTIFNPEANNGLGSWAEDASMVLPNGYEGASAKVVNSTFIVSHGGIGASTNPTNLTYSRSIARNPVYKLGFTATCLICKNKCRKHSKTQKPCLYSTEGSKSLYNFL
jgi:N-acetylneuraminic acid mutarotase